MTRPVKVAAIVAAVIALQVLAVVVYLRVERGRRTPTTFNATDLSGARAPRLVVERLDGTEVDLAARPGRVRMVHFWATWCGPCRKELPELLARAAAVDGLELVAVSVDDDWDAVRRFFPAGVPREVVRARDPLAHRRWGAWGLPDTYVMAPDGRLVERVIGARDWSAAIAIEYLRALPVRHPPSEIEHLHAGQ